MSKPRRPKYQHRVAQPAAAPVEPLTLVSEPVLHETMHEPVDTAPHAFEAPAEFQDIPPETVALPAESFAAPVEEVVTEDALVVASPRRPGAESFGTTVMNYFLAESEAFATHMRALAGARSVAEFVRLQIGEYQRAADSTLICWGMLTVSASRSVTAR